MSAIIAILHLDGAPVDDSELAGMLAASPHRGPDGQRHWIGGNVALAHQHFWMTPEEEGETQPLVDEESSCVLTCDARLDNRGELLAALGLSAPEDRWLSDATLVLRAYEKWGIDCALHLDGDFAFALWDGRRRQLLVARDRLGARDVCYWLQDGRFLVASEISQLLAHPAVPAEINENAVADYLVIAGEDHEETFYRGIFFVPPAHCLLPRPDGALRKWRYWDVDPRERIRHRRDEEYAEHYLELLTKAVRARLRTVGPVGISMSGGLDSTAIAAVASALLPGTGLAQRRLKSFSYVFDELTCCDEREYIRPVVERWGIEATYIPCDDKWTLRNLPEWPTDRDAVLWDAFVWLPHAVMRAAQQSGCRLLLAGHYGDVLFTGGQYWALDVIREGRLSQLARIVRQHRAAFDWRRDVVANGLRPLIPRRAARLFRRIRPRPIAALSPAIHPDLAKRTNLRERKAALQRWSDFPAPGQWPRYQSLMHSGWDTGVTVVRKLHNRYGLELESPYWDVRLVEFVMALPGDQLGRPGRDRWAHRNALTGLLPASVLRRSTYTSFYPLFELGMRRERAAVDALMADPQITRRMMVDPEWLRSVLARATLGCAELSRLWLCVGLELWLQRYW